MVTTFAEDIIEKADDEEIVAVVTGPLASSGSMLDEPADAYDKPVRRADSSGATAQVATWLITHRLCAAQLTLPQSDRHLGMRRGAAVSRPFRNTVARVRARRASSAARAAHPRAKEPFGVSD